MDTARASAFEPYGAPAGATPTVAQLAARGVAVAQAQATCNWTLPSHATLFTGRLPRAVGLGDAPGGNPAACAPFLEAARDRMLPLVLQRAGYQTAAVSANPWIASGNGFGLGFDRFVSVHGHRDTGIDRSDRKTRLRWAYEALLARVDDGAAEAWKTVGGWLSEGVRSPFFWFVNLIECHSPYLPPRPWNDLSARGRWQASREARRHLTLDKIWWASATRTPVPEDTLGRMRHLYGRSVSLMDAWLGRLLQTLDERGLLDDTVVIVTSDHGENLGEGCLLGHAFSLDQRLLHVPLVIAGPDHLEFPAVISLLDLPRIIGTFAGLAANPWARDRGPVPDGVAVSQYSAMVPADDPRLDEVTRLWDLDAAGRRMFCEPMTAATDGHRKVVRHGSDHTWYDLDSDPGEVQPRAVDDSVSHLMDALTLSDAADLPPDVIAQLTSSVSTDTSDELRERLRQLGYL